MAGKHSADVDDEAKRRLKEYWDEKYTGDKSGRIPYLIDVTSYDGLGNEYAEARYPALS